MLKKQPGFFRKYLTLLVCFLLSISLVLMLGLNQVVSSPPSLIQQGNLFYKAEQFSSAINIWQQALEVEKNPLTQATILNHLSLAYQQIGQWEQARETINTSLKLIYNLKNSNKQTKLIYAQALNTQAGLLFAQGQTEEALQTWQRATTAYTEADYIPGKIGSLINQSQAQQTLGFFLQARKTLAGVEEALINQSDSQLKIIGLQNLGNIFRLIGDLDNSRRVLEQSLAITTPNNTSRSAILLSLGNTVRAQGDTKTALEFYQQAATTSTVAIAQIQAQVNQLSLLIETKQQEKAQGLFRELLSRLNNLPPGRTPIYARINFAKSLINLGDREQLASAQLLADSVQQASSLGDRRAESYALGYLGKVYEKKQQWSQAQELTQKALQLAQSINASDIAYQWQWQLGRILKAKGEIKPATAAYEVAFTTLKSLRSDLVAINSDIQFDFRESVEPVYREYVELLLFNGENTQVSEMNLKQARIVIESLQLAELDNYFRSACLQGQIVPVEEIERSQAAVIYPIILKDKLEVIVSLPQQPFYHYTSKVSQSELELVLEDLRQNLEKPYTTPEGKSLAETVYKWLIRPVEAELSKNQVKTLVFVLDGSLRQVPMAALYDGKQYLIEKYGIALTPGLELLGPKPLKQSKLSTLVAGLTEARHGFSALPNVSEEVQAIKSEIPSQILLNQTFTSSALRQQVDTRPFSIVHLATHGQFSSDVNNTFVLAWDKPVKVNELKDLLQGREEIRPEPIELLVLSACETAEGDKRSALGLAGVAVRSGAKSTLASLWSLDDASGSYLVSRFYRELAKKNMTKAEALRQAQLELLQDPDYRHPIHWAPYVLLGNWL